MLNFQKCNNNYISLIITNNSEYIVCIPPNATRGLIESVNVIENQCFDISEITLSNSLYYSITNKIGPESVTKLNLQDNEGQKLLADMLLALRVIYITR